VVLAELNYISVFQHYTKRVMMWSWLNSTIFLSFSIIQRG